MIIREANQTAGKHMKSPSPLKKRLISIALLTLFLASTVFSVSMNMKTISIQDGEKLLKVQTMNDTDPEHILEAAGVTLEADDIYTLDSVNGKISSIQITRAFDMTVCADGQEHTVTLATGYGGGRMAKSGIYLDETDVLSVPADTAVFAGQKVIVTRVGYNYIREESAVPFTVVTEYSESLHKGETKTTVVGEAGVRAVTVRQKLENGKVILEETVQDEVIKEPVNQKVLVGTKEKAVTAAAPAKTQKPKASVSKPIVTKPADANVMLEKLNCVSDLQPAAPIQFDSSGRPVHYKQLITGKASAYWQPSYIGTSTGLPLRTGHVAVNPKQIPYGTKMFIRTANGAINYGYAVAADTGGFASQGRITVDLFFNSEAECYNFGIKDVEIYILE